MIKQFLLANLFTSNRAVHAAIIAAVATGAGCLDQAPTADDTSADDSAEASKAQDVEIVGPITGPIYPIQTCLTQAPDATMTLGEQPGGYYFSHVESSGTTYATGVCPYYVVDVVVPGTYTAGTGLVQNAFALSGQINDLTPNQNSCPNITQTVKIYKKTRNLLNNTTSSFSLIENESRVGTWEPSPDIGYSAYCALTGNYRYESAGSFLLTDTYRVLFQPLYNGSARAARVNWQWAY